MSRIKWSWVLCGGQILLAVVLLYYEPYEYLETAERIQRETNSQNVRSSISFWERHWPPRAGVVLRAVNYPAMILSVPFDFGSHTPLYSNGVRDIYFRDITFLGWVGVVWYWIGTLIENRKQHVQFALKRRWLWEIICVAGLILAVIGGVVAVRRVIEDNAIAPERWIFIFGVFWALLLFGYFVRKSWLVLKLRLSETV